MEYKDLESILAELHRVASHAMPAFRSRLRVLRDNGVPSVRKPGKGSRVDYTFRDLWQAHLGLHCAQFGLPPLRVKFLTEESDRWLRTVRDRESDRSADIWLMIWLWSRNHSALAEDQREQSIIDTLDNVVSPLRLVEQDPAALTGLINLSQLTREAKEALAKISDN
jgi:hypothetical protein